MFDLLQHGNFIDNMKFPLSNKNINNLMLINFNISLITKRFFRSFDRPSDKTVTLSEWLPNINKFRNKILDFSESFTKVASKLFVFLRCTSWIHYFLKKSPPVNSSQFFFFNGSQNWVHLPIFHTLWFYHTFVSDEKLFCSKVLCGTNCLVRKYCLITKKRWR